VHCSKLIFFERSRCWVRAPVTPQARAATPQVALLIETSNAYARGLLQGIVRYIREHRPWSFHLMEQGRGEDPPPWLAVWRGDGIIARIETPPIARAVWRAGLPAVDVSAARLEP
jgi:LacI family transcriptional regulator